METDSTLDEERKTRRPENASRDLETSVRIIATPGFAVAAYCLYVGLSSGSAWSLVLAYSLLRANQQAMATLGQRRWTRWD